MKIVNTDNFGGDYPDERVLSCTDSDGQTAVLYFSERAAQHVADAFNQAQGGTDAYPALRYYKAVPNDYVLQPGFEP